MKEGQNWHRKLAPDKSNGMADFIPDYWSRQERLNSTLKQKVGNFLNTGIS